MDGTALMIVSILLFTTIVALCIGTIVLASAAYKSDDRKVMADALKAMTDVLVTEKADQLSRLRISSERELGGEWIDAQRDINQFKNRMNGFVPASPAPDIHVPSEDE